MRQAPKRLFVRVTRLRKVLRRMIDNKPKRPAQASDVRVAVFTDTFDEINGVANTYRRLYEYAAAAGRKLDIYCFSTSEGVEREGTCSITRFKRILPFSYYENLAIDLAPHFPMLQALHNVQCDVAHVTAPDTLGTHGVAFGKLRRLPLVGVYHTSLPEYAAQYVKTPHLSQFVQQVSWQLVKGFYEQCDLVLATTPKMAERLRSDGLNAPLKIMARGVDAALFHPQKRSANLDPARPPVILYTGRIATEKNLEWYAHILLKLQASGLSFTARFVGDGPYREELQALLPDAEFWGYKQGEELARAYADADVFAFPSCTDTFGNVVLEAMASGLPAVVADAVGPGELVENGVTGFLAPDAEDFGAKLALLVRDSARRGTMAEAARAGAETRSWNAICETLWQRYEGLVWEKSGG